MYLHGFIVLVMMFSRPFNSLSKQIRDGSIETIYAPDQTVYVGLGQTAILPCKKEHIHNKVVWTDQYSTLLTSNGIRIIDDWRISVNRPGADDWNLNIKNVRMSDAGTYICQEDTMPIKEKFVLLRVINKHM